MDLLIGQSADKVNFMESTRSMDEKSILPVYNSHFPLFHRGQIEPKLDVSNHTGPGRIRLPGNLASF
jgi:hypothetical protein